MTVLALVLDERRLTVKVSCCALTWAYRPVARDVTNWIEISGRHLGGQLMHSTQCTACSGSVCGSVMVNFCAVVGCGKRSDRDKGISFYRLPAVITH